MPQQTDLISNFVKLSIRRGSSLTTLSKSPDRLRTVVDAFKATARRRSGDFERVVREEPRRIDNFTKFEIRSVC